MSTQDKKRETYACTNCGEYAGTPVHDYIAAQQARIDELECALTPYINRFKVRADFEGEKGCD